MAGLQVADVEEASDPESQYYGAGGLPVFYMYRDVVGNTFSDRSVDEAENWDVETVFSGDDLSDQEDYALSCFPSELDFWGKSKGGRNGRNSQRLKSLERRLKKQGSRKKREGAFDACLSVKLKAVRIKETVITNAKRKRENTRKVQKPSLASTKNSPSENKQNHLKPARNETKETSKPQSFFENSEYVLGSTNGAKFEDEALLVLLMELQNRDITPNDYDLLVRLDCFVKPKTLSTDQIDSFTSHIFTSHSTPPHECYICMEDYIVGDVRKILTQCGHYFHEQCIRTWLGTTSNKCPIDGKEVT